MIGDGGLFFMAALCCAVVGSLYIALVRYIYLMPIF